MIDIQVSVESLRTVDAYAKCLALLGYKFVSDGELDLVYPFFTKPEIWASTHHVHLCIAGGMQEAQHLAFRNYLRRHPEVAVNYAALKRKLATEHNATTRASRENYSLAKTDFVQSVLASAGSTSSEAQ